MQADHHSIEPAHQTLLIDPARSRLQLTSRTLLSVSEVVQNDLTASNRRFRAAMLTLTYDPRFAWSPKHVSRLTSHISKWGKRRGFVIPYVWVLELQQNGNPHYHILFWLPRGYTIPKPDNQGWWPYGHTRVEWAKNPVRYLAKYTSKLRSASGDIPSNARLYNYGGLTADQRRLLRWAKAPLWLRKFVPREHDIKRESEGWWLDVTSGIRYRTPYVASWNPMEGGVHLEYVGFTYDDVQLP